jgi:hypothetical protein
LAVVRAPGAPKRAIHMHDVGHPVALSARESLS